VPIHDWTRVDAGIFHDFHLTWIGELKRALNSGLLPPAYYALAEQIAGGLRPDVLTLQTPGPPGDGAPDEDQGSVSAATTPPKVRLTVRAAIDEYTGKRRSLVIRHVSRHRIVALIEILSPGNKASRDAMRALLRKAPAAVTQGIHLLIVDLFPPGPHNPQGIHGAIWQDLVESDYEQPRDKPLTLVAYSAGPIPVAYVEPVAVGDTLPDMPLFLTPDEYINTPLEATYQAAYAGVPRFYRNLLEGPNS
jgi:Protein of unknown function (DUF4058)